MLYRVKEEIIDRDRDGVTGVGLVPGSYVPGVETPGPVRIRFSVVPYVSVEVTLRSSRDVFGVAMR